MLRRLLLAALLVLPGLAAAEPIAADRVELVPATSQQVLDAVRGGGARVSIVNVWASWCVPCRQEFPDLVRFYRTYKDRGVALILVSGDFASEAGAAKEFLAEQGIDFRTFLKAQKDQEFIDGFDTEWTGALPATFVYDRSGRRRHSFLTPVTYASLEREVKSLLEQKD